MALKPGRERDDGLSGLLADVLRAEGAEAELLVRYADEPDALSADDRARIERELETSPALRDQLRVLREFDLSAALAHEDEPVAVHERAARGIAQGPRVLAPRRRERAVALLRGRSALIAVPLAAAATIVILVLRSGTPELRPPGGAPPGPVAQLEPPPLPAPTPPTFPEPVTPEPEAKSVEIAKAPAPQAKPDKPAPVPEPKRERAPPALDYVAMAEPVYRAPFGAPAFEAEGTYIRGAGAGVTVAALAPAHVARTVSPRPTLFWYLSSLPEGSPAFVLTIAGEDDVEPLFQGPLPAPKAAGLQRVSLADLGVELPVGKPLHWSIALRLDPENPSRDVIAAGGIDRSPEPPDLAAALAAAKPLDRAAVFAAAGIWYDALAELDRVARDAPGEAVPRARLRGLLESAGIPDAAHIAP